jgi:hypothetical protein
VSGDGPRPDDEALAAELRALVERVDPVPPLVTDAAKAVLGWRRLDAELAELLADSALEADALALTRSGPRARQVTFGTAALAIEVEITSEAGRTRLVGQLAPAAAAGIEVQRDDGTIAATTESDDLGRFRVELASGTRARLRVTRAGEQAVETSWLAF